MEDNYVFPDRLDWLAQEKISGYKKVLQERLFRFSVELFNLLFTLPKQKEFDVFRYQLSKSGTSVGANYEEAIGAFSEKDFCNKLGLCLKEARESNYWLRIMNELNLGDKRLCKKLMDESLEFIKIFTSSLKTSRSNFKTKNPKSKI